MKRIMILFLILAMIISGINLVILKPISSNNMIVDLEWSNDQAVFNNIEEGRILNNFNKLNGFFTENRGQVNNESIRYYIQGQGVWFLNDGVVFEIMESIESKSQGVGSRESIDAFDRLHPKFEPVMPVSRKSVVLKLNFEGCKKVTPIGRELLPHRSNFFYGNDSSKWHTNVPNYQEILYEDLYDNIDLKYYNSPKGLKYDFIVHPGGNPNDIKMSYEGAEKLNIDSSGNLRVETLIGDILDSDLLIYQDIDNNKNTIKGSFEILNSMTYGFKIIGDYDSNIDLIIDPLIYSTFIGGTGNENINDIVVDSNGNAFVTAAVGQNFPTTPGAYDTTNNGKGDAVIFKLNSTGTTLMYSTFIGGAESDSGASIAIDTGGSAYVTGHARSNNFPTTFGAYDIIPNVDAVSGDGFILKLNSDGSTLLYSSYFGGNSDDYGNDIAVDSSGNVYIGGSTESSDFPTTPGAYDTTFNLARDVFALKLNPAGNGLSDLIYSTFIGSSTNDYGYALTIDSSGNTYVTGATRLSSDFPITPGAYDTTHNGNNTADDDVFVSKLNPTGSSLLYSTFIGDSDIESGYDIAVDSSGTILVTGHTSSSNFPTTSGAYDTTYNGGTYGDVFVIKLNPAGNGLSDLVYSTFIGGIDDEWGYGLTIDSSGNAYVTGQTNSLDFPTTSNAYDNTFDAWADAFFFKLNSNGSSLLYSTFIGGNSNNVDVSDSIAIDFYRNVYLTGGTTSPDFPTTPGAYDTTLNLDGFGDGFVLKLGLNSSSSAIGLQISRPTILRTNPIYLYSNATDIDDSEEDLTPIFEFMDPNELIWNSTYFSNLHYNNSRWEACFTPSGNATIGLYDFRVRFHDSGMAFSSWCYLNNSLTVLNNIPDVIDLSLSISSSIQNQNLSVYINTTDIEDEEQNLTIELNYRDSAELIWNTIYFSYPEYIDNRWECSFYVPFYALFGYYDFRVRCNDYDGDFSAWLYFNDSLLVYNTGPDVVDLKVTDDAVFRTNSIFLFINGSDYETPENMLILNAQFKQKNKTDWTDITSEYSGTNNNWKVEFITEIDTILGIYDLRVNFIDNESASSGWFYFNDTLEVLNNPPKISETLDEINVGIEPTFIDLTQYESDLEDNDENLIWSVDDTNSYEYLKSVKIIDIENNILEIVPKENVVGQEDMELKLTDKDNDFDLKSNITINIDSRITESTPKVRLISPDDGSILNTLTPKLEWELEYSGEDIITYSIFIDKNPDPYTLMTSDISATSFTIEDGLEPGKTYYWKVIPKDGLCISDPFSFTINSVIEPIHYVNLTVDKNYIVIKQGDSNEIELTLENEGNVLDNYEIKYNSNKLQSQINIDRTNVQLMPAAILNLKLSITIPENFETGDFSVLITAISQNDLTVTDEEIVNIEVVSEDFVPNHNVKISVSPNSIDLYQNESKEVTLTILNDGNIIDEYLIYFESDDFTTEDIQLFKSSLLLKADENNEIKVKITIPENKKKSEYKLEFIAKSEIVSDNTMLTINVKQKENQELSDEDLGIFHSNFNNIYLPIILIIIAFIVISSIFIGGTEVGKFKFLTLFFVPLLSKFQREKKSDNFARGQILGYIKAKPGEHYNAIKYALELNNGTLAYHVRILEKCELIFSKRDGFYTRFYPAGTKMPIVDEPQLNDTQKNIIEKIRENPGITQHDIISLLGTSQQVVSYNLTNLTREKILKTDQNGREKKYFLNHD